MSDLHWASYGFLLPGLCGEPRKDEGRRDQESPGRPGETRREPRESSGEARRDQGAPRERPGSVQRRPGGARERQGEDTRASPDTSPRPLSLVFPGLPWSRCCRRSPSRATSPFEEGSVQQGRQGVTRERQGEGSRESAQGQEMPRGRPRGQGEPREIPRGAQERAGDQETETPALERPGRAQGETRRAQELPGPGRAPVESPGETRRAQEARKDEVGVRARRPGLMRLFSR